MKNLDSPPTAASFALLSLRALKRKRVDDMLLPKRLLRRWEPVVGMAPAGDSTLRVAALIALAAGERLLLFITEAAPDDEPLVDAISAAGFPRNDGELHWLRKIGSQNYIAALQPFGHFRTPNAPAGIDTACRVVAQSREDDDALLQKGFSKPLIFSLASRINGKLLCSPYFGAFCSCSFRRLER